MVEIHITRTADGSYEVTLEEGGRRTRHRVTATPDVVARYGSGVTAERLLGESFRFLLEREPKEAILGTFDLTVIERYFPEYPRDIAVRTASPK
jgi:hypothetical protein